MFLIRLKKLRWLTSCVLLGSFLLVHAQQNSLHYTILHKGDAIGQMSFTQNNTADELSLKITSNVQTRVIMNIKIQIEETSHYQKSKLVSSTFKKVVNDKAKVIHETKANGEVYQLTGDSKKSTLNKKWIAFNTTMLYYKEPLDITELYSENFQQMVKIQATDKHIYKMLLPDGNYNVYYYHNDVCAKVDIHNGFFNLQMLLKQ